MAAEIKPEKSFNSVDVYYYFYDQTGAAYFDSMRLEPQGTITSNSYDANGNYITSVKDPNGNAVSFGYDAAGNKTSVTDANGKSTVIDRIDAKRYNGYIDI